MQRRRATNIRRVLLPAIVMLAVPSVARAELVRLSSGRAVTVESLRFDGDTAILTLPEGGEIRTARSLVVEVLPDEMPDPVPDLPADELPVPPSLDPLSPDAIHALVDLLAARVGVDVALAHAVVQVESNYQANAVSPKGAMGLMQLMPVVAREYALDNPFDPGQNLEAGLRHLRGLLDKFDVRIALAAYNAGEGAVSRYGGVPPFRETQDYVKRIMALVGAPSGR